MKICLNQVARTNLLRRELGIVSLGEEVRLWTVGVPEPRRAAVGVLALLGESPRGARILAYPVRVLARPGIEIFVLIRGVNSENLW